MPKINLDVYLSDLIDKNGPNGCWVWHGNINDLGYGRIHIDGVGRPAHAVVYEREKRVKLPKNAIVRQTCTLRCCVNPDHHYPSTRAEFGRELALKAVKRANPYERKVCKRGHRLIASNLYIDRDGTRICKKCRLRKRSRVERNRLSKEAFT